VFVVVGLVFWLLPFVTFSLLFFHVLIQVRKGDQHNIQNVVAFLSAHRSVALVNFYTLIDHELTWSCGGAPTFVSSRGNQSSWSTYDGSTST
jgi:hypothetical protein